MSRQIEFFNSWQTGRFAQKPGEPFGSVYHRFEKAFARAEMEKVVHEKLAGVLLISSGITDEKLIDRFVKLNEPTPKELYDTARKYELTKRQVQFFKKWTDGSQSQKPGESCSSLWTRFDRAIKKAELDNISKERLSVILLMAKTADEKLLDCFLELDDPTKEDLYREACNYEAREKIMAELFPERSTCNSHSGRRSRR